MLNFSVRFFLYSKKNSGRFDTSGTGSMIPLSVSEILALHGFCDEDEAEEELGILVVGLPPYIIY